MGRVKQRGMQQRKTGKGNTDGSAERPNMAVIMDFDVPRDEVSPGEIQLLQHFVADLIEDVLGHQDTRS